MTSTRKYRVSSKTMRLPDILWEGIFEVPWHQREFDWNTENVEQFWDDIQRNLENGEDDYFIGSITLTERGGHLFHIQDGQQRLTTYSMMLAALTDLVPGEHKSRVHTTIYDIEHGAISSGTDNLRIKHQERDQNTYSAIMKGEQITPNGKLNKAQELLTKKERSRRPETGGYAARPADHRRCPAPHDPDTAGPLPRGPAAPTALAACSALAIS